MSRRVEELQGQLAEEKERVAHLTEQQEQELSRREQQLAETKETLSSEASGLQEKIAHLVRSQPAPHCSAFLTAESRQVTLETVCSDFRNGEALSSEEPGDRTLNLYLLSPMPSLLNVLQSRSCAKKTLAGLSFNFGVFFSVAFFSSMLPCRRRRSNKVKLWWRS